MIEKIAAHVADFSPRLQSNTRALYQYCPIPAISFPQLDNELFCNIYYLRHLCDTTRFPNWPIRDAVCLFFPPFFIQACTSSSMFCLYFLQKPYFNNTIHRYDPYR